MAETGTRQNDSDVKTLLNNVADHCRREKVDQIVLRR
jgi:hypothetical protein